MALLIYFAKGKNTNGAGKYAILLLPIAGIILIRFKGYDLSLNLSAPLKSDTKIVILRNEYQTNLFVFMVIL